MFSCVPLTRLGFCFISEGGATWSLAGDEFKSSSVPAFQTTTRQPWQLNHSTGSILVALPPVWVGGRANTWSLSLGLEQLKGNRHSKDLRMND